jgi:hypothetical protein
MAPRRQVIDRAPHVEDVLPGQAAAVDHILEEQKPFEIAPFELAGLPLLETDRVGTKHHVSLARQRRSGVVHRIAGQSGGLALTEVILAVVLMPKTNARRLLLGRSTIRH